MTQILKIIDRALSVRGLSDAAASRLAVGHPSLIKNMRNGKGKFSFEALTELADVLELECYFGPKREPSTSVVPMLEIVDNDGDTWTMPTMEFGDRLLVDLPFRMVDYRGSMLIREQFYLAEFDVPFDGGGIVVIQRRDGAVNLAVVVDNDRLGGYIVSFHRSRNTVHYTKDDYLKLGKVTWRGTTDWPFTGHRIATIEAGNPLIELRQKVTALGDEIDALLAPQMGGTAGKGE